MASDASRADDEQRSSATEYRERAPEEYKEYIEMERDLRGE